MSDYNTVTDENAKTWNKKSKENICFKTSKNPNLFTTTEEREEARKCWIKDSNEKTGSTLSLHIAAYENSVKVDSNKTDEENLTQKSNPSKFVDSLTKYQDNLEFPRQMDSIEQSKPQIMQFKASQKLFSPNQEFIPSFNNIFEEIFEQKELVPVILWFLSIFLISAKLIFGCYYSRIRKRDAALFEQPRHIEAIPVNEAPENIDEARMRHEMLKWFPKLDLQPLSITESNFKSMRSTLKIKPHPKVETLPKFLPLDSNRKVTFSDTCLTFITYGEDLCRGESNGEKEENTQDIAPSPAASPATITTSSK